MAIFMRASAELCGFQRPGLIQNMIPEIQAAELGKPQQPRKCDLGQTRDPFLAQRRRQADSGGDAHWHCCPIADAVIYPA